MFKGARVIYLSDSRCFFKQEKNEAGKTIANSICDYLVCWIEMELQTLMTMYEGLIVKLLNTNEMYYS